MENSNVTQYGILASMERRNNAHLLAKVLALCKTDPADGVVYRAKVDQVLCTKCKMPRWEDGTRCKTPWCGIYTTTGFSEEEEGRG